MIDFVNEELFRKDSISKDWTIIGDNISLTNDDLYTESFDISETINSDNNIIFGSCVASVFKFTTSALNTDFKDKDITVNVVLDEDFENPFTLGTFVVAEETLSADKTKKEIVAYDGLYKIINTDIGPWYNALTFPMTLSTFRGLLFNYFGIAQKSATLVNDNMSVEKTIDVNTLSGAEVVKAICEINGVFGHIDRNGLFEYKQLEDTSVYEITASMYSNCEYEEYEVQTIDRLQIREESGDIGVVVGTGSNDYIIEDNFLVYGKSSSELTTIATNILGVIDNISFIPCKINCIGNPCVEVGDRITITKRNGDSFESYVLQRYMKGIQSLKDEIIATGDEVYPDDVNGINYDIRQLKGKSNVLERTIEETRSTITDVEQGLQTEIRQTAEGIEIQIADLQSQIDGETAYYERETGAPTLLNYPYWDFTSAFKSDGTKRCAPIYTVEMNEGGDQYPHFYYSEQDRKEHRSDLVYVDDTNLAYRFVLENGVWYWKEIADSDYTQILSRISTLEATSEQLQSEYTEISATVSSQGLTIDTHTSQLTQTASQISSLVSTTTSQGNRLTTAESRITQNSNSITSEVTRATQAEGSLSSRITQNATAIEAKVSQTGGNNQSFAWKLQSNQFQLISGNKSVFVCNSSGIAIDGAVYATEGRIGNWSIDSGAIKNSNVALYSYGSIACVINNSIKWAIHDNGNAEFHGNVTIDGNVSISGYATTSSVNAVSGRIDNLSSIAITTQNFSSQNINAGQITSGTISADRIAGGSITGGKIAAETISAGKLELSGGYFNFGSVNVLCPSTTQIRNLYLFDGTVYRQCYVSNGYVRVN